MHTLKIAYKSIDLGGKRAQVPFCKIWENALKVSQT